MCPNKEKSEDEIKPTIQEHRNVIIETLLNLIRLIQRRANQTELEEQNVTSSSSTIEEESDDEVPELE